VKEYVSSLPAYYAVIRLSSTTLGDPDSNQDTERLN